jgi:NTE family protein
MKTDGDRVPISLQDHVIALLEKTFGTMEGPERAAFMEKAVWFSLKGGETLFYQGDKGDKLFLLVHGRMKAVVREGDELLTLGEIVQGEMIGEMAIISEEERMADVVAVRDCHLISLNKDDFKALYFKFPSLGWNLSRLILKRFARDKQTRKPRRVKNVAFVPGSETATLDQVINDLIRSTHDRSILVISNEGVSFDHVQIDLSSMSKTEIIALIDQAEKDHDLVIYRCEPGESHWNDFCHRQADEIFVITDGEGRMSSYIIDKVKRRHLALAIMSLVLRPLTSDSKFKIKEITGGQLFDYHFQIRPDQAGDIGRLSRHIFDQSVGLVLAGGGARAMSHLGVWKAIKEVGLPVDRIGGTSMGAFLGGLMAMDYGPETIFEIVKEIAYSRPSRDLNPVPYASIIRGKNLDKVLKKYYKGQNIEDCVIPFYCVSTDLTKVGPAYHREGDMFTAIRASGSLPGIVPPVPIGGHWHVDGAIVDNFPIEEMINWGVQTIIGVSFDHEDSHETSYTEIPSLQDQLLNGLFGSKEELSIPSIIEAIMISTTAYSLSRQIESEGQVDVLIKPEVSEFGLLEWKAFVKVVESGYVKAMKAFDSIDLSISG